MVSTPLKNISQIGSSSQILGKKHVPNHQPDIIPPMEATNQLGFSCHFGTTIVQQPRAWNLNEGILQASKIVVHTANSICKSQVIKRLQKMVTHLFSDMHLLKHICTYIYIYVYICIYIIMPISWYVISIILHVQCMPSPAALWSGNHHALAPSKRKINLS